MTTIVIKEIAYDMIPEVKTENNKCEGCAFDLKNKITDECAFMSFLCEKERIIFVKKEHNTGCKSCDFENDGQKCNEKEDISNSEIINIEAKKSLEENLFINAYHNNARQLLKNQDKELDLIYKHIEESYSIELSDLFKRAISMVDQEQFIEVVKSVLKNDIEDYINKVD